MDESERLNSAAREGNINGLYEAVARDPYVLDRIEGIPFAETPLHEAARHGQTRFVAEIMNLKPSLGRKLNGEGFSPMHLAVKESKEEIALRLFQIDKELARVKGREGTTPLHCAVEYGKYQIFSEILRYCPDSIKDLTVRKETALHIAVKNNDFDALSYLTWSIRRSKEWRVLSCADENDNSALHLATRAADLDMVELLLGCFHYFGKWKGVNQFNKEEKTALDILDELPNQDDLNISKIRRLLIRGGAKKRDDLFKINFRQKLLEIMLISLAPRNIEIEVRDPLLVVAGLIVTATFAIGVNPPGGFWQDSNHDSAGTVPIHNAGTPILATTNPKLFCVLISFNAAGFLWSFFIMNELTRGLPMQKHVQVALFFLYLAYLVSIIMTGPTTYVRPVLAGIMLCAALLWVIIMFRLWLQKKFKERQQRGHYKS